jgi:hypothetical protein
MLQATKESLEDFYRQGLFTRALGRPRNSNPYRVDSTENFLWDKGWRLSDASKEQQELDQFGMVLAANYIGEKKIDSDLWFRRAVRVLCLAVICGIGATAASLMR